MSRQDHIRLAVGMAVAMMLAILPLPYGYYGLLRVATLASAIYFAVRLWDEERYIAYGLGFAALVFNPVWPVHFDRGIWAILNFGGASLYTVVAWKFFDPIKPHSGSDTES